jgi:hypothetical protein
MWAVREHQFTVSRIIDSYNPIRTLVSGLVRKERPTRWPVSDRSTFEIYTLLTPMPSFQFSQSRVRKERTKQILVLW